jgi:FAD/FMN-containing dehydrogenase
MNPVITAVPVSPRQQLPQEHAIEKIKAVVGPEGWLSDEQDIYPYLREQRGLYTGTTLLVVRPADTREVADVIALCSQAGVAVIPQGGNTGLCGAAVPPASVNNIVLSLARLRTIRSVDPGNFTITVEAGCILAEIQAAADAHNRFFPLSLGAEGSCQIGGNLSTNAGGIQVLRYGNARDLTLGLEIVLPDGRIMDCLRSLRKDNTGYDLKQLFIGAEGTLGVITAATLRIFPKPVAVCTAYVSMTSLRAVIDLLDLARERSADQLTAFEFMPRFGVDIALRHVDGVKDPLPGDDDWYVLMEMSSSVDDGHLDQMLEKLLEEAMDRGLILNAAIAASESQRNAMWRVREGLVEGQRGEGASIKFDVSVPVMSIPDFAQETIEACLALLPGVRPLVFGHCGDGNVHFNLTAPVGDDGSFMNFTPMFSTCVFDQVHKYRGSISAEHGIGKTKRDAMAIYKSDTELDIMRRIKQALDPQNLFNPDKVIPPVN